MNTKLLLLLAILASHLSLAEAVTCYYTSKCKGPGCASEETCVGDNAKCYSLFAGGTFKLLLRGCWIPSTSECSPTSDCVISDPIKSGNNSYFFCCCTGDYCNSNSPASRAVSAQRKVDRAQSYPEEAEANK